MKAAEWKEIKGKSPTGYLTETESLTMKEEYKIYQMTDWSEEVKETIIQEEIDEILNEFQVQY